MALGISGLLENWIQLNNTYLKLANASLAKKNGFFIADRHQVHFKIGRIYPMPPSGFIHIILSTGKDLLYPYINPDYNSPLIYWWGCCNLSISHRSLKSLKSPWILVKSIRCTHEVCKQTYSWGGGGQCTIAMNLWRPYISARLYLNVYWTGGSICIWINIDPSSPGRVVQGETFFLTLWPWHLTYDLDFQGRPRPHPGRPRPKFGDPTMITFGFRVPKA